MNVKVPLPMIVGRYATTLFAHTLAPVMLDTHCTVMAEHAVVSITGLDLALDN